MKLTSVILGNEHAGAARHGRDRRVVIARQTGTSRSSTGREQGRHRGRPDVATASSMVADGPFSPWEPLRYCSLRRTHFDHRRTRPRARSIMRCRAAGTKCP